MEVLTGKTLNYGWCFFSSKPCLITGVNQSFYGGYSIYLKLLKLVELYMSALRCLCLDKIGYTQAILDGWSLGLKLQSFHLSNPISIYIILKFPVPIVFSMCFPKFPFTLGLFNIAMV